MFGILVYVVACVIAFDVNAQILPGETESNIAQKKQPVAEIKKAEDSKIDENIDGVTLGDLTKNMSSSNNDLSKTLSEAIGKSKGKSELVNDKQEEDDDIFIPEGELSRLNTPTADNSKRGGQFFVEVDEKGRMKKAENIFLYYDNFKITNYISSTATCDVRFNILSNLDRKINQLDVKLVWPDMTTTLSFSNVSPNTQTYYNYSLIGNGCYEMNVAPNIVVNRCRVKGLTASECAAKIVWLSK